MTEPLSPEIIVNGVVSRVDEMPYVQLLNGEGRALGQLTMAMTHKVAIDMLRMAARTEADAMLVRFFKKHDLPQGALHQLLLDFRDFRRQLDEEDVRGSISDPDTGEKL